MIPIWFAILCLMVAGYVVLDGWDFGAGALHYIVARNPEERREVISAIGPLWGWHEVWLLSAGGVMFVAFPRVLATAFPAYYLALYLVLWTLLLRGISLELRSHIPAPLWATFWDFTFCFSNVLLAILFGTALGNVIRGMPLAPDVPLMLPLFTNFGVHGKVGILDWYTVSTAVFALVCLSAHGASYLAVKTASAVHQRSRSLALRLWLLTVALLVVISVETFYVRPELFSGMASSPAAWAGVLVVVGALVAIFTGLRSGAELRTFIGGCVLIAGLLATAAASLFPVMLHSTLSPDNSITAWNGSSDVGSIGPAMYWWPVAIIFAILYFVFIMRYYGGRVPVSDDTQQPY